MSITAALSVHADRQPDSIALEFENDRLSWSHLDEAVHRLAAYISTIVPAGQSLALHLPNCPALALLFLAAARAGREAQVLDPAWPDELLETVHGELSHPLLVTSHFGLVERDRTIFLDHSVGFNGVADSFGAPATYKAVAEPSQLLPFYVGFTSGSTGTPKGYRRDHQSWLNGFEGDDVEFGVGDNDVVLAPGAMAHSLAVYAMVRGLNAGAKVILCRQFRPGSVARLIRCHAVTVFYAVPTQLRMILDFSERMQQAPAGQLRLILSTGSKWPEDDNYRLKRFFPAAEFCEFYGCSELGYMTIAKASEDSPAHSVGRAFPGVNITIRDRNGVQLPTRRPGLIFADSPLLFMEYACGDEGEGLRAGNAMSVGDIGFLDENGFLYLVGRFNRMIISSGKNVYPEEVEEALRSHPVIAVVAVVGLQDEQRGERLVALLQCCDGESIKRADIIRYIRAKLPLYKVPRHYGVVRDWPVTQSGKPDFAALRNIGEQGQFEEIA